jgi:hypothetical protein
VSPCAAGTPVRRSRIVVGAAGSQTPQRVRATLGAAVGAAGSIDSAAWHVVLGARVCGVGVHAPRRYVYRYEIRV